MLALAIASALSFIGVPVPEYASALPLWAARSALFCLHGPPYCPSQLHLLSRPAAEERGVILGTELWLVMAAEGLLICLLDVEDEAFFSARFNWHPDGHAAGRFVH